MRWTPRVSNACARTASAASVRVAATLVCGGDGPSDLVRLRAEPGVEANVPNELVAVAEHERVLSRFAGEVLGDECPGLFRRLGPLGDELAHARRGQVLVDAAPVFFDERANSQPRGL